MSEPTKISMDTDSRELPSIYKELGVKREFKPPDLSSTLIMIQSFSGSGKTTLCASIPDALVLSFQKGAAKSVIAPRAYVVELSSWDQYDSLRTQLVTDARSGKMPFKQICIDTVDEWYSVIAEKIIDRWNKQYKKAATSINEVGKEGKGFGDAAVLLRDEVSLLMSAGYGVVATMHLMEKNIHIGDRTETVVRPFLTQSAYKMLIPLAYLKAQIGRVPITTETISRELNINGQVEIKTFEVPVPPDRQKFEYRLAILSNDTDDEIKARLPDLPPYIVLPRHDSWTAIESVWDGARAKALAQHRAILAKRQTKAQPTKVAPEPATEPQASAPANQR